MSTNEWISWDEAAALVGCPVPTIDWHKRLGHIESRPHYGNRPSLKRDSVVAFATWRKDQEQQRRDRRATQRQTPSIAKPPATCSWISVDDAALKLGVKPGWVYELVQRGRLKSCLNNRRRWVSSSSLRSYQQQEASWISYKEAARQLGCNISTIQRYVDAGQIESRGPRRQPSLALGSVLQTRQAIARRREEAVKMAQDRLDNREAARRRRHGPPDNDHVWLRPGHVAAMLYLSLGRVRQLTRLELLPAVRAGSRWWYRRDHIELVALDLN